MESGNRTDNMERRIAPDGMTEDGKKESEAIDRRVEELMAPEEDDGNGRKKKKRKHREVAVQNPRSPKPSRFFASAKFLHGISRCHQTVRAGCI